MGTLHTHNNLSQAHLPLADPELRLGLSRAISGGEKDSLGLSNMNKHACREGAAWQLHIPMCLGNKNKMALAFVVVFVALSMSLRLSFFHLSVCVFVCFVLCLFDLSFSLFLCFFFLSLCA